MYIVELKYHVFFSSSDFAMNPFSDSYFEWEDRVKADGFKVLTILSHPDIDVPIVSGNLKEMKETLKNLLSARPDVDYLAPVEVRFCFVAVQIIIMC